jgi:hypothetical protein
MTRTRISHDFYPTPAGVTRALTDRIHLPRYICEPCAGNGAITDELYRDNPLRNVLESDITWNPADDATTRKFWQSRAEKLDGKDWATVTNPPFSLASTILPLAYVYSPWGVAFLLRLSYLEPTGDRAEWLEAYADNLRCIIPVSPRPKFRRDSKGSDSVTVAWMVWDKAWSWRAKGVPSPFAFAAGWKKAGNELGEVVG